MTIAVHASEQQWKELESSVVTFNCLRINASNFTALPLADAYFLLQDFIGFPFNDIKKPILVHSVVQTLNEIHPTTHLLRINGWSGFLAGAVWEIAGTITPEVNAVFQSMHKTPIAVPDEPGFINARVISMIINEAYFALGENVSSKQEIDTAMKLGTNYPFGPFEWSAKIGIHQIYQLLNILKTTDPRYQPAPLLIAEAQL
jgi:3-hydroxybutyryl-CoA dehydrogenase